MRIFSMVAILICVVVIGWFTATYFMAATSDVPVPQSSGVVIQQNPVGAAQGLETMDKERTKMLEGMMEELM